MSENVKMASPSLSVLNGLKLAGLTWLLIVFVASVRADGKSLSTSFGSFSAADAISKFLSG